MDFRKTVIVVGVCGCAVCAGLTNEFYANAHNAPCEDCRSDIAVCEGVRPFEAVLSNHTPVETPGPARILAANISAQAGSGIFVTHEVRLGENLFISDGLPTASLWQS